MALAALEYFKTVWRFQQTGNAAVMVAFWQLLDVSAGSDETDIAEGFYKSGFAQGVQPVLHNSAQLVSIEVQSLTSEDSLGLYAGNSFGLAGGEPLAPFIAMNVKQSVSTRVVRSGQKRIPFIAEGFALGFLPVLDGALRYNMEQFWGNSSEHEWTDAALNVHTMVIKPVIVGRTNIGTELEPDYILDLDKIYPVRIADVNKITSQNSRKV